MIVHAFLTSDRRGDPLQARKRSQRFGGARLKTLVCGHRLEITAQNQGHIALLGKQQIGLRYDLAQNAARISLPTLPQLRPVIAIK